MTKAADYWIDHLSLQPHPEGGYYAETYRAASVDNKRAASTGIYFLLGRRDISRFHRIDADEMWHFYAGDSLIIHMIDPQGHYSSFRLGSNAEIGERFQAVVPAGCWFGAEVVMGGDYGLVGCTVAPGFEFSGFELADCEALTKQFPNHSQIIQKLT